VFSGGPVEPEVGFVVHSPDYRRPETVVVNDRLSMTSSLDILRDIGAKKGPAKVLVAFGYAGWGPDQLEGEIKVHAWGIAEADPTLVFDEDRDKVWDHAWSIAPTICKRRRGRQAISRGGRSARHSCRQAAPLAAAREAGKVG
jgi:putative transcriptional regulator